MGFTVEATYENGILKLAQPLPLKEHEKVRATLEPVLSWAERTAGIVKGTGDHEALERLLAETDELEGF
jgi:predicted DNA-binding antitoxin AbrB/MazE fold protein